MEGGKFAKVIKRRHGMNGRQERISNNTRTSEEARQP